MADRNRLHPLRLCAVMVALLMPAFAGAGPALDLKDLRATLRGMTAEAPQAGMGIPDVPALLSRLGMKDAPVLRDTAAKPVTGFGGAGGLFSLQAARGTKDETSPKATKAPVDVSVANFRVMLAGLAQIYSAQNNQLLINAQGARGAQALSVRSGTVTLADLQSFSAANGMAPRADGTLTAPVVLWPDATLVLTHGERLALARDTGAFIMSMGRLEIKGALIESVGAENAAEPTFTPFITVVGGGSLHMEGTTLRGMGFGRTMKFAGLTIAGNPLISGDQEIILKDNLFDALKTVSIAGVSNARITGNTFQNAGSAGLNLLGTPDAEVRENLFRGASPTNAIRVQFGSDRAVVKDNVFLKGGRVAILIDRGSNHVSVNGNLVWKRDGAGIKFLGTQCGHAQGNILIDNAQKGIEVRKSNGTVVQGNVIAGNQSAGVWVSAQAEGAQTSVHGNRFEGNGAGLSSATGAEIWIEGNNFKRQLPKLLDGDIASLTNALVRDLAGSGPLLFSRGQSVAQTALAPMCGDDT